MKARYLILTLVILTLVFVQLVLSCNSHHKKVVIEEMTSKESKNEDEPPPPSFSCANPLTLNECLLKICESVKPEKDSLTCKFILFETENCYAIVLNPSEEITTKKDDMPFDKYYSLSKNEYKSLAWKEVMNKIKSQIKEFSKTKEFENSSLAKAKAITIRFDDGDLISLK